MALTKLQKHLALTLKCLGVSIEVGLPIMLYLKTEEEQAELARFILDNLDCKPSEKEIIDKVSDILNAHPGE